MSEYLEDKLQESGYLWCLHCEKAYKVDASEKPQYELMCPYCGASALLDGLRWQQLRDFNPQYPETPGIGVYYPM